MASQDTEITLGLGKIAGLFFALTALCAVFLGLGYSLGKSAAPKTPVVAEPTQPVSTYSAPKPTGSLSSRSAAQSENKPGLTFYKAVEQKDPDSKLPSSDDEPAPAARPAKAAASPELARAGSGYVVQVAAVSKQEDAQALADALKKKSYAVLISTNPPNDKLYHVQVGPFVDFGVAENVRNRLVGDGYNPILKK